LNLHSYSSFGEIIQDLFWPDMRESGPYAIEGSAVLSELAMRETIRFAFSRRVEKAIPFPDITSSPHGIPTWWTCRRIWILPFEARWPAGESKLYSHQALSFERAERENVVVVTPTASGKTLCYNLPVLQRIAGIRMPALSICIRPRPDLRPA
jgi:ATP-dependent helicase YprA (DUF1998 family)